MFYKYFCSSHIPEEKRRQNKKKHLHPELVVPCGGPSRLDPGGLGVPRAGPAEHSDEGRQTPLPSREAGDLAVKGQVHTSLAKATPLASQTSLEGSKWALQGLRLPGYF